MWCRLRSQGLIKVWKKCFIVSNTYNPTLLIFSLRCASMTSLPWKTTTDVNRITENVSQLDVNKSYKKKHGNLKYPPNDLTRKKMSLLERIDEIQLDMFPKRSPKLTIEEVRAAIRQLGFTPYNLIEIAAVSETDPSHPTVTMCFPLATNDLNGRYSKKMGRQLPFPTMLWMSSPELHAQVAQFEVEGYVSIFEEKLKRSEEFLAQMDAAHRAYAAERWALLSEEEITMVEENDWVGPLKLKGIAGIKDFTTVKCLHCHYAHFLARPEHGNVIGAWVHELVLADNDKNIRKSPLNK